jgi:zinc transport system ATP-binding protein
MPEPLIEIQGMDASYQGTLVLNQVSLTICENDFIGIIGPNGGGKTTLLKVLMGLHKPASGSVTYHIEASRMGYLPQGIQVDEKFPITVKEVVAAGLDVRTFNGRKRRAADAARTMESIEKVGLAGLASKAIGELSGGELQRAMLARALVSDPKLLVLDEPETHVDNLFEMELYRLLRELNKTVTILLVSHDIGTISPYIKTIACVNRDLHYHPNNEISEEQLKVYNCPIEIITHGTVPHRVMKEHKH